jgi:hypothetical protein
VGDYYARKSVEKFTGNIGQKIGKVKVMKVKVEKKVSPNTIYTNGTRKAEVRIPGENGVIFCVRVVRYDDKDYFAVKCNDYIKCCMPL